MVRSGDIVVSLHGVSFEVVTTWILVYLRVTISEIVMTQLQAVATLIRPIVFLRGVIPAPQALAPIGGRAQLQ